MIVIVLIRMMMMMMMMMMMIYIYTARDAYTYPRRPTEILFPLPFLALNIVAVVLRHILRNLKSYKLFSPGTCGPPSNSIREMSK